MAPASFLLRPDFRARSRAGRVEHTHGQHPHPQQGGGPHVHLLVDGEHGGHHNAEGGGPAAVQVADEGDHRSHTVTPITLLPTSFISLPMITSNIPASVMMPKYRTENTNRAAVGAVELKPALIMDSTPSREM